MIKQNIAERMKILSAAGSGREGSWFREIFRRQWAPGNPTRPALWVTDNGCRRSGEGDSDATKTRILSVQLVLDLEANWKREADADLWSDRVETICLNLQNYRSGPGVYRSDYMSDDPFDVVLLDGKVEAIWLVEFEVEYFVEVPVFGRTDE